MKKLKLFLLAAVATLSLASCSNMSITWGELNFEKVHIIAGDYNSCVAIKSWHDDDLGIEVKLKDKDGSLFLSEGTYILVSDYCPICRK